jgi:transcription-repair coupling factor (superfamily II helicase)
LKILKDYNKLKEKIFSDNKFQNILTYLERKELININNIKGSLKAFALSYLYENQSKPLYIIAETQRDASSYLNDLEILLPNAKLISAFTSERHLRNKLTQEDENEAYLLQASTDIISNNHYISILTKDILEKKIQEPEEVFTSKIDLKTGQKLNFNQFTHGLIKNGFKRTDYVGDIGEIAIRGGIVDIYPISFNNPIRLEFWGDEIESIREFDPISQRSNKEYNSISLIQSFSTSNENSKYILFLDIIPKDAIIIIDDLEFFAEKEEFNKISNFKKIVFNSFEKADIKIVSKDQKNFDSSIQALTKVLLEQIKYDFDVFITAESKSYLERLSNIIFAHLENDLVFNEIEIDKIFNKINWIDTTLNTGFEFSTTTFLYTEHQIFQRNRLSEKTNNKSRAKKNIIELNSLKNGDYVVHEDKGIARFEGFRSVKFGDSYQDCVQLAFEDGDVLYVSMNYINKIQKYSAQEGIEPKLSKLGSSEWERRKQRHKKKIKEIARELIKLYAKRKMQSGYAFDKDTTWQKEFEASFIYDDTIDQKRTTEEIKADMESNMPMDRLLCGDVGFGKTEIAMRAAFKAVQSGKQVAVLVPTTILAHQHLMSFKDRLHRYPVNIQVLSRFVPKNKQNDIVQDLKVGRVDILIGTHRILSKDIQFKDLGLLIVDEEQRFGVKAKEKLREMRVSVDTLTLTATPIPRTLNFSLMGARDLSIMETPPKNRLPIHTEIQEWDEALIASVILKEIKRGGQVYFVNDRIQDLELIMHDLKESMPNIKFKMAHGQMPPKDIENIMQKFISGEIDVLCTTKIVESGLDIPNANTMIINKAHNFGLAELYQLRGRVGRTNLQAYCYLLIPNNEKISKVAIQRLQAIEEFTDLGSGFQIALRDMEIRGAGNLLGAEQSGAIYDIGFDLYQKVLDEAVRELKIDEFANVFETDEKLASKLLENSDVAIETPDDCFISEDYVPTDTDRFEYYKRLYALRENQNLVEMEQEFIDKYGKLPDELQNLLFVIKLRIQAIKTGFTKIILKKGKLIIEMPEKENEYFYQKAFPIILDHIQTIEGSQLHQGRTKLSLEIPIRNKQHSVEILWKINKSLEELDYE